MMEGKRKKGTVKGEKRGKKERPRKGVKPFVVEWGGRGGQQGPSLKRRARGKRRGVK